MLRESSARSVCEAHAPRRDKPWKPREPSGSPSPCTKYRTDPKKSDVERTRDPLGDSFPYTLHLPKLPNFFKGRETRTEVLRIHRVKECDLFIVRSRIFLRTGRNVTSQFILAEYANHQLHGCPRKILSGLLLLSLLLIIIIRSSLRSQQNWGEGTGVSHVPTVPAHTEHPRYQHPHRGEYLSQVMNHTDMS